MLSPTIVGVNINDVEQSYQQRLSALQREGKAGLPRLERFYQRALQRLKGEWVGIGHNGEAFGDPAHPYAQDLGIIGEGSLFQRICGVRTSIGQKHLARYLMQPVDLDEALARQQAVSELRGQLELREKLVLLGEFESFESRWETFAEWLALPPLQVHPALKWIMAGASSLLLLLVLAGVFRVLPWETLVNVIAPILAVQASIGLQFRERVNQMQSWIGPVSIETRILAEGLRLLESQTFVSPKLNELKARIQGAGSSVKSLERLLNAMSERNKDWFYLPSLLLMLGTRLAIAIDKWRNTKQLALQSWLDAWGEFEALNSLACYAFENPDSTTPIFIAEGCEFEAKDLGHPLLDLGECVRNDIALNNELRFAIISGSNMAGKSTLLRSIGMNAVLAYAGAPVRAAELKLSPLTICASLSIVDSLLNGRSRFMAEMDRLRLTVELSRKGQNVLFLIDEIMSGTNSSDRRVATESVVRALITSGAIGVLSTHDLALTEIATQELQGANFHMCSKGLGDPLDFDYRLKFGINIETNALAIAKLAGVV
jgi:hypothetical protein